MEPKDINSDELLIGIEVIRALRITSQSEKKLLTQNEISLVISRKPYRIGEDKLTEILERLYKLGVVSKDVTTNIKEDNTSETITKWSLVKLIMQGIIICI